MTTVFSLSQQRFRAGHIKMRTGWVAFLMATSAIAFAPTEARSAVLPGNGVAVTACTSLSLEGWFKELIVLKGLEKLGYSTEMPRTLSVPAEHQATATGDCSYTFDHWVPMHASFLEPIKNEVELIGPTVEGAAQGLLIDKKTADAHSISKLTQLKDPEIAKLFDTDGNGKANLCCTSPGWGAERVVNHLLDTLDLRATVDHEQGEYSAMIADTVARFKRGEPVFFYTWTPWWLLGTLRPGQETTWLEVDPKDCEKDAPCGKSMTGFPVNDISIVANKSFLEKDPAAAAFLRQVKIPIEDLNAQNALMLNGEDKEADVIRHADDWIAKHKEQFDAWVSAGMAAAK